MPKPGQNADRHEASMPRPRRGQRRREPWPPDEPIQQKSVPLTAIERSDTPPASSASLRDQMVHGVRDLARQVRALQERYEDEHRRLADTLEFLTVQSRDLERQLVAFGKLASTLERDFGSMELARVEPVSSVASDPYDLYVRCLGGFEVTFRGRPVELGSSRKGRLLFKFLATRPAARRAASKELLAELLWPEAPLERALVSLQSAVHQLRRAMGRSEQALVLTPAIVYADDHYSLNANLRVRTDLELFRRCLEQARLQETAGQLTAAGQAYTLALDGYGGELLPEERYEEWVLEERRSVEADHLTTLSRRVELALESDAPRDAVLFGRRLLEIDSTREDIHRSLMCAFSRLGQRSEALRQYRSCELALQAELEVAPEPATRALADRLIRGEPI